MNIDGSNLNSWHNQGATVYYETLVPRIILLGKVNEVFIIIILSKDHSNRDLTIFSASRFIPVT